MESIRTQAATLLDRARLDLLPSLGAPLIEVVCDACGWLAVTSQGANQVWVEHVHGCPAVGGAVRLVPEVTPLHMFLSPMHPCTHRLVRRQIAVTAAGSKRYAVVCELCGRRPLAA